MEDITEETIVDIVREEKRVKQLAYQLGFDLPVAEADYLRLVAGWFIRYRPNDANSQQKITVLEIKITALEEKLKQLEFKAKCEENKAADLKFQLQESNQYASNVDAQLSMEIHLKEKAEHFANTLDKVIGRCSTCRQLAGHYLSAVVDQHQQEMEEKFPEFEKKFLAYIEERKNIEKLAFGARSAFQSVVNQLTLVNGVLAFTFQPRLPCHYIWIVAVMILLYVVGLWNPAEKAKREVRLNCAHLLLLKGKEDELEKNLIELQTNDERLVESPFTVKINQFRRYFNDAIALSDEALERKCYRMMVLDVIMLAMFGLFLGLIIYLIVCVSIEGKGQDKTQLSFMPFADM